MNDILELINYLSKLKNCYICDKDLIITQNDLIKIFHCDNCKFKDFKFNYYSIPRIQEEIFHFQCWFGRKIDNNYLYITYDENGKFTISLCLLSENIEYQKIFELDYFNFLENNNLYTSVDNLINRMLILKDFQ